MPARYGKDRHCDRASVVAEPLPRLKIAFMAAGVERPLAVDSRVKKVAGIIADDAEAAVGDAGFHGPPRFFGFAEERRCQLLRRAQFTAHDRQGPLSVANRRALRKVVAIRPEFRRTRPGYPSFLGGEALVIHYRLAVIDLQLHPLPRGSCVSRVRP